MPNQLLSTYGGGLLQSQGTGICLDSSWERGKRRKEKRRRGYDMAQSQSLHATPPMTLSVLAE